MRVSREQRKWATLLMLKHRRVQFLSAEADTPAVTAYTMARWHSIPQSQAWGILNELCQSRFVKRHSNGNETVVITYRLTKSGENWVVKHVVECIQAMNLVYAWKMEKFKHGMSL